MNIQRIRWIASYPKSGNTWVRMFLQAYEFGVLNINKMNMDGDISQFDYQAVANVNINEVHPEILLHYRPAALLNKAIASKYMPILKTHMAQHNVKGIELIPRGLTASAVYLVRDPRSVVVSYANHQNVTVDTAIERMNDNDLTLGAHNNGETVSHIHFVSSWSNNVMSWTRDTKVPTMLIKYEDLKEDPEYWFEGVLEMYQIKLNRQRLKKAVRLTELDNLKKQEAKNGFVEKLKSESRPFFGSSQRWQDVLTEKQLKRIELDHGELMQKFNYIQEKEHGSVCEMPRVRQSPAVGVS